MSESRKSRTLALEYLGVRGACDGDMDSFKEMFGDSVEVTVELAVANAGFFDFDWAGRTLLWPVGSKEYHRAFKDAHAAARKQINAAYAEYRVASLPALARYESERDTAHRLMDGVDTSAAYATCQASIEPIRALRRERINAALRTRNEALARAFAEIYIREGDE
jgi:hypothetical protein